MKETVPIDRAEVHERFQDIITVIETTVLIAEIHPGAIPTEEGPQVLQRALVRALTEPLLREDLHIRDLIHLQAEVRDIADLPEPIILEVQVTEVQDTEVRAAVLPEVLVSGVRAGVREVQVALEVRAEVHLDLLAVGAPVAECVPVEDVPVEEEEDNNCIIRLFKNLKK